MPKRKKSRVNNLGDYAVSKKKRKQTNNFKVNDTPTIGMSDNVPTEPLKSPSGVSGSTTPPAVLVPVISRSQCSPAPQTSPAQHEGNIFTLYSAGNEQRSHKVVVGAGGEYEGGRDAGPLPKGLFTLVDEIGGNTKNGSEDIGGAAGCSTISEGRVSSNPSARGVYLFPPTLEEAHSAYLAIGSILKPLRNTNGKPGFRDPELNHITRERFEQMRHFCYTYWKMQKESENPTRSKWTAASEESAKYFGRGSYLAQNLRNWSRKFINDREYVPEHLQQRRGVGRGH